MQMFMIGEQEANLQCADIDGAWWADESLAVARIRKSMQLQSSEFRVRRQPLSSLDYGDPVRRNRFVKRQN